MILIDANLLVYAYGADTPHYAVVHPWLEQHLTAGARVGLPWASLLAFVRLVSNPRIVTQPVAVADAWRQVETWLQVPTVWVPEPTASHAEVLGPLLRLPFVQANDVPDAHLAALALEHDLTLSSADTGFARFPGLRWENPLRRRPTARKNR
jgi:toxin-antitoxin system PIN domain toxin